MYGKVLLRKGNLLWQGLGTAGFRDPIERMPHSTATSLSKNPAPWREPSPSHRAAQRTKPRRRQTQEGRYKCLNGTVMETRWLESAQSHIRALLLGLFSAMESA